MLLRIVKITLKSVGMRKLLDEKERSHLTKTKKCAVPQQLSVSATSGDKVPDGTFSDEGSSEIGSFRC